MEDTSREIRQLVHRIVMSRSEEDRFLMCAEMHEAGKEFAKIGIPDGLSPEEERSFIYRRIHGEDFPVRPR